MAEQALGLAQLSPAPKGREFGEQEVVSGKPSSLHDTIRLESGIRGERPWERWDSSVKS